MSVQQLADSVRRLAQGQEEAGKPVEICFGRVVSKAGEPLVISVDDRLFLTEKFLVLSNAVRNYRTRMTVSGSVPIGDNGRGQEDILDIQQDFDVEIHNELAPGEWVLLMRFRGGQRYLVVDREKNVSPAWQGIESEVN